MGATTNQRQQDECDYCTEDRREKPDKRRKYHCTFQSVASKKRKKPSNDTILFGMKMIVDCFGDGCHKHIMDLFNWQCIVRYYYLEKDDTTKSRN